jgi:hypothetical protein
MVREDRDDIPRHTQLMSKPLIEEAPRWWEQILHEAKKLTLK